MSVSQNNYVVFPGNTVARTPGRGYQRLKWALLTSSQLIPQVIRGTVGESILPTEFLTLPPGHGTRACSSRTPFSCRAAARFLEKMRL